MYILNLTTPDRDNYLKYPPVLALDFDGTIRHGEDGGLVKNADDVHLFDDVEEVLLGYFHKGWIICGVGNQGGVAFGYKTFESVGEEIGHTLELFEVNPFSIVLAALNHEGGNKEPYSFKSLLRKPNYGMLAIIEHVVLRADVQVDWNASVMVGDMKTDQQCAVGADIQFVHTDHFFGRGNWDAWQAGDREEQAYEF